MFAKADYDPAKPGVEAVLDSSRYFVVRVEEGNKKAYIGMGFLERTDSFDFSEHSDLIPLYILVTVVLTLQMWHYKTTPSELHFFHEMQGF